MESVRSILGELVAGASDEDWVASPGAGTNPIGFTAWHIPAVQDWAIHTWMRNLEPIRARPEWQAKGFMTSFVPFGMPVEKAQTIARATRPEDVVAYASAVLASAAEFLPTLTPEQFDGIPPNRAHLVDARYEVPAYMEEIDDMYAQPFWRVFAGACTGHCRGHLGELELALATLHRD
jgi:hypothetical protein